MTETAREPVTGGRGAPFVERDIGAAGVRCLEAGRGAPVIVLPGADGLRLGRAHELLAERFRVIGLEVSAVEAVHEPSPSTAEVAQRAAQAIAAMGLDHYSVVGTSAGGALAVRLAALYADRLDAVVLESPAAADPDLEEEIGGLRAPTLLLFGTLDRVTPAGTGRRYREKLGSGHLVLVYNASHAIAADRPEAFASLVADFLERREQFVVNRSSGLAHP